MGTHSQINWGIVIVISKEPLEYWSCFKLQIGYHIFLGTLSIIRNVPYLVQGLSNVSQVINDESGCLIHSSLCDHIRVSHWVVYTLAHCDIVEDTKGESEILIEHELWIRGLGYLGVRDWVLIDTIILYCVLDVCWLVLLRQFPIGNKVWIIIRVVAIHSQLLILELLETMELSEHLEFFKITSKTLGLIVVKSSKINRIRE